jgi:hypothetical protein
LRQPRQPRSLFEKAAARSPMAGPGQGEASEVTATPRPGAQGKATNEKRVVRRYVVIARDLSRSSWAVASLTVALAALFALWPRSASPLVSNGKQPQRLPVTISGSPQHVSFQLYSRRTAKSGKMLNLFRPML